MRTTRIWEWWERITRLAKTTCGVPEGGGIPVEKNEGNGASPSFLEPKLVGFTEVFRNQ